MLLVRRQQWESICLAKEVFAVAHADANDSASARRAACSSNVVLPGAVRAVSSWEREARRNIRAIGRGPSILPTLPSPGYVRARSKRNKKQVAEAAARSSFASADALGRLPPFAASNRCGPKGSVVRRAIVAAEPGGSRRHAYDWHDDTSIRFPSGSRRYTDVIGPSAPVRGTGPSSTRTPLRCKCSMTEAIGTEVMKHRSAEPGVGCLA